MNIGVFSNRIDMLESKIIAPECHESVQMKLKIQGKPLESIQIKLTIEMEPIESIQMKLKIQIKLIMKTETF